MLIMKLFHDSEYRCLKHFYQEKFCKHMRYFFPKVVSYNCFVELEKDVAIPLAIFIKKVLLDSGKLKALQQRISTLESQNEELLRYIKTME